MEKGNSYQYTRMLVQSGLIIALALVIRNFSYMIYLAGAPAMRISFSGIFTKLPGLLFGPMFGGLAAAIVDIVGFMMKPEGGFIPWLTVTAVAGGTLTAILWKLIRNINTEKVQLVFICIFVLIGLAGLLNHVQVSFFKDSAWAKHVSSLGSKNILATIGLELTAVLGIALFVIDILVQKKYAKANIHKNFLKLLIVIGISDILVTTANTYILQSFIPALGKIGFIAYLIPRIIQQVFMTVFQAYVISFLVYAYEKWSKQ